MTFGMMIFGKLCPLSVVVCLSFFLLDHVVFQFSWNSWISSLFLYRPHSSFHSLSLLFFPVGRQQEAWTFKRQREREKESRGNKKQSQWKRGTLREAAEINCTGEAEEAERVTRCWLCVLFGGYPHSVFEPGSRCSFDGTVSNAYHATTAGWQQGAPPKSPSPAPRYPFPSGARSYARPDCHPYCRTLWVGDFVMHETCLLVCLSVFVNFTGLSFFSPL